MTRTIDAPRELVFDAFTNAEHLAQWYGPLGFRSTVESDLRVGGNYHITMYDTGKLPPDVYHVKGSYREIVRPERLAYTVDKSEYPEELKNELKKNCGTESEDVLHMLDTFTFEDVKGKTKLTLTMRVASDAIRDGYIRTRMEEGWGQSLDKLDETLAKFKGDVVVERVLNAPVERVWDAISNNDRLKEWYFVLDEFRPEVGFKFEFEGGPREKSYTHQCEIVEVIPQHTLAYSWRYKGYQGNSIVTFELFPEDKRTRLRLTHAGLDTFTVNNNPDLDKHNFVEGWTSIMDKSLKGFVEQ